MDRTIMTATRHIRCPDWREDLLARAHAVRGGYGDDEVYVRLLACEIAVRGWPVRRLVGDDGAWAALLLASLAPLPYRASWAPKLVHALTSRSIPRPPACEFLDRLATDRDGW